MPATPAPEPTTARRKGRGPTVVAALVLVCASGFLVTRSGGAPWLQDAPPAAAVAEQAPVAPPESATLAELERRHGPNLLVPDPLGAPPPGAKELDSLLRWYGDGPALLNANLRPDAAVVDCLLAYCTYGMTQRHARDPSLFAPGAADYAAVSDDHRSVTVHIRPGQHWQFPAVDRADPKYRWLVELFERDPPELTADDVRFTVRTVQHPDVNAAQQRSVFQGVEVEVLDRYTYRLTWPEPNIYALQYATGFTHLLPEFLYACAEDGRRFDDAEFAAAFNEHWYNNRLCGYGPYRFVRHDPGREIVLERVDGYGPLRPAIRTLRWQILGDPEQVVLRLKDGQLDHVTLQPQQFKRYVLDAPEGSDFKGREGEGGRFETQEYTSLQYFYVGWNNRRPLFQDARVRRAMTHALNREDAARGCFFGQNDVIESPILSTHELYARDLPRIPFDLETAAALLDEAGFSDSNDDGVLDRVRDGAREDFRFSIRTFESPEFDCLLTMYQDDLRKIGVEMTIVPMPWGEMQRTVYGERDFDAYVGAWSLGWEVNLRTTWHSSQAAEGGNHVGFANAELDELADRFLRTFDPSERREQAVRMQEILAAEQPYTFLYVRRRLTAYRKDLENVVYRIARPQLLSFPWHAGE